MQKHKYYVSISDNTIQKENLESNAFEVMATDEEVEHLRQLMKAEHEDQKKVMVHTPIPYKSADHNETNAEYSEDLLNIYKFLYQIGVDETKDHISRMGIIEKLNHMDYNHEGYER